MKKIGLKIVVVILLASGLLAPRFYWLATDKDYYGWPAVTQCRACEKTVWIWQDYERRAIPVALENTSGLVVSCSMSGLMHTGCKGSPKPAKVTIEPVKQGEWY